MKMKKLLILFFVVMLFVGCESSKDIDRKQKDLYKNPININIDVKKYGTISLVVYPNLAPITVENFINLVNNSFYNGSSFHRIIDGFMIQGGSPNGIGYGGTTNKIKGEFSLNGVYNNLKHERGVISMTRADDYNSASSQFFIVQTTNSTLDGRYAAFGRVTNGIEIVDKICKDTKVEDDDGTVLKENRPIIEKIYIVNEK